MCWAISGKEKVGRDGQPRPFSPFFFVFFVAQSSLGRVVIGF